MHKVEKDAVSWMDSRIDSLERQRDKFREALEMIAEIADGSPSSNNMHIIVNRARGVLMETEEAEL